MSTTADQVASQALGVPAAPSEGGSREDVIRRITERAAAAPIPNIPAAATVTGADPLVTPTVDLTGKERVVDPNAPSVVFRSLSDDVLGIPDPSVAPVVEPTAEVSTEAAVAPDQAQLEKGIDVGTGDSLFRVRDAATGQFKQPGTDVIELAFRDENGKITTHEKTLPELARMARDGIAGQKVIAEVKLYREREPHIQSRIQQVEAERDAQIELNRAMLSSEDEYIQRVLEYADATSPEKRLAQLEAERSREMSARQSAEETQRFTQEVAAFHSTRIEPVINAAIAELPVEMVLGRIAYDTDFLKDDTGKIPKARWGDYATYINTAFKSWARDSITQQRSQKAEADRLLAARASATVDSLTSMGRAMSPPIGGSLVGDARRPEAPARTKEEAMERIISRRR